MYKVSDRVIIMRYHPAILGTIVYIKEYDIRKEIYIVEKDDKTIEHYREDELILDR